MVRLYLYFTRRRESINSISRYKNFNYLFIFWITFLRNFFELDGNTTSCWSSLSHRIFFTSGICFGQKGFFAQVFLRRQSFRSKCSDICYTPISRNLQTAVLLHLQVFPTHVIHKKSLSWSSTSDSQAIPHTLHIFSPLIFSFCFSFCFHFLVVSCITFPIDVSKSDCSDSLPDWKSISLPFVW